ncbi:MAG: outer membrane lipoprotein-sorting protein [Deltaproteobacteria bacterium]|nr:outer membrane lipoprotein-sorting protein [Deltaproteobacteria bacterium]MBW2137536.1 outer membrane lipoprotein-sorting protein [Deltaproteobacteria bacterium]
MKRGMMVLWSLFLLVNPLPTENASGMNAQEVVEASFDYWRGKTSIGLVDMVIHRPGWERVMTIRAWTKGQDLSLIKIIAPAKDKGNGTLKKGREMWIFNPKVNRVIKIPPSMMSQAWMGSDFSNNDLAKSDSLIKDYVHKIVGTETHDGKRVYLIESTPKPDAPVVWGMQTLKIREDHIFLEEGFFDEDLKLVKKLSAQDIGILGGKLFPRVWKMQKAGVKDEYTLLKYKELLFDRPLPKDTFTLSKLRLPVR